MTKAELVDAIARDAKITKVAAERALNSFTRHVVHTLRKRDKITLTGFGTFTTARRKARQTLNPQTKEEITIPAAWVPRFRPGKVLRERVR